jgi:predicted Zn-ribbon and HTH transcriptional regulator
MYSDIVNAFDKRIIGAVFLDIKAAYDTVLVNIFIERLAEMNIPKLMIKFNYNVTSERHLSIKFDTTDVIRRVTRGFPQGSMLNPLLYYMSMVCLDKSVKGICKVLQFSNDVAMYTKDTSPDEALAKLENSARELSRYLSESRLQSAPEKCELCTFKKKRSRIEKEWAINVNGKMITSEKIIKFIGLYFEADLKWNHQVEAIRQKRIKSMAIISYI